MKGKRTEFQDDACPVARSVGVVGDWWSLLIIREALGGTCRFGEFHKRLGLAKNILSARLGKLVAHGILEHPAGEGAAHREYRLTEKGESLHVVVAALWQWGERYCCAPGDAKLAIVDAENEEALAPLELRTASGRKIGPRGFKPLPDPQKPPK